jgi:hypothetical protein
MEAGGGSCPCSGSGGSGSDNAIKRYVNDILTCMLCNRNIHQNTLLCISEFSNMCLSEPFILEKVLKGHFFENIMQGKCIL